MIKKHFPIFLGHKVQIHSKKKQRTPGRVFEEPTCRSPFPTGAAARAPQRTAAGPGQEFPEVCVELGHGNLTPRGSIWWPLGSPGGAQLPGQAGPGSGQRVPGEPLTPHPYLTGVLAVLQVHDALAPTLRVAQHVVLRVLQEGRGAGGGDRGVGQPAGLQVQRAARPQPAALRPRRPRLGAALRLLALLGGDGEPGDDGRQNPVRGSAAPLGPVGQLAGGGGGDGGAASLEEGAELPHGQPLGPAELRAAVQPRAGLHGAVGAGRLPSSAPGSAAGGVHGGAPRRRRGNFFVAQSVSRGCPEPGGEAHLQPALPGQL